MATGRGAHTPRRGALLLVVAVVTAIAALTAIPGATAGGTAHRPDAAAADQRAASQPSAGEQAAAGERGTTDEPADHTVVDPGETLWEVAIRHAPSGTDPRGYVQRMLDLNGLEDATVPAWTVVLLPS